MGGSDLPITSLSDYPEDALLLLRDLLTIDFSAEPLTPNRQVVLAEIHNRLNLRLSLGRHEIKQLFLDLDEVTVTQIFTGPLLECLGYNHVRTNDHSERIMEYGKDLYFKHVLPSGHTLYFVGQAKRDKIRSSVRRGSEQIQEVLGQLNTALNSEVFDADLNARFLPDHACLFAYGGISREAEAFLEAHLTRSGRRNLLVFDPDRLMNLNDQVKLPAHVVAVIRKSMKSKQPILEV